jgi:drug/metabolite transporter (DMT)-like permease
MNLENKLLLKGIALMLGAMSVVPTLDVIAKILSESYPVIQISWARFAFHTLWLLPLLYWKKLRWWQIPKQPGFHLLRSLMLTLATLFFFTAIKTNPIPNALTLLFVSPLIVAMLAPFVLGERFDIFIGIGVLVGFVGVVIVLQPDTEQFRPSLMYALVAGFCYALYIITTRKLSLSGAPLLTLFYTAIVGTLVLGPMAISAWVVPDLAGILMAAAMGLVAATSHFMIIKAFECATASELSPFGYFEIVVAMALSFFVFKFVPTDEALIGLIIIIISGLFVSWRSMKNNRATTKQSESVIEML